MLSSSCSCSARVNAAQPILLSYQQQYLSSPLHYAGARAVQQYSGDCGQARAYRVQHHPTCSLQGGAVAEWSGSTPTLQVGIFYKNEHRDIYVHSSVVQASWCRASMLGHACMQSMGIWVCCMALVAGQYSLHADDAAPSTLLIVELATLCRLCCRPPCHAAPAFHS